MKQFSKDIISLILFSILTLIIIHFLTTSDVCSPKEMVDFSDSSEMIEVPISLYGIPIDSFDIVEDRVKSGMNITSLLSKYNISNSIIGRLLQISDTVFDFRKIRAGNKLTVFLSKDSVPSTKYIVYEHTAIEYVLFDLNDTVHLNKLEKEVTVVQNSIGGKIKSSLWNSMTESNLNPVLAIDMSEIFAWTIDFFDLKKGDNFKIIFDEQFVDSQSVGISKIHAVLFQHQGVDYYAIPFIQDEVETYFDINGLSLRKAFLKAPLSFYRITSKFSNSRLHPVLKIRRPHHGVDYAAPIGTPVMTIGDGKVIEVGYKGGAGHMVKIKHNSTYTTAYLHLSKYGKGIQKGATVKQGEIIGYVGSSGLSTGPHLDFRVYKGGTPIDPLKMESPPAEPVSKANQQAYNSLKDSLVKMLTKIDLPI
jgi:murein DD-endopeptidase MepM/ murein hydrolase activator NlpD